MAIHDENLPTTVAGHLVNSLLQQFELQVCAVSNGPRLLPRFEDLAEVVFRKHHRIFRGGGTQRGVAHVNEIRAQRQMRAVLFKNSERQQAKAFGLVDGLHEIRRRQFLPMDGQRLCPGQRSQQQCRRAEPIAA